MKTFQSTFPKNNLKYSKLSIADDVGIVFFLNGRVFRGICSNAVENVTSLFSSGLIKRLIDLSFIPNTSISNFKIDGFDFILEHERIEPISYPFEWSFEMLRKASLFVLSVNRIANEFGFELKDCHGYNVIFNSCKPIYVDIGSFVPCKSNVNSWRAEQEFIKFYYYPLQLWSSGHPYLARKLLIGGRNLIPHESFFRFKYPLLSIFSPNIIKKFFSVYYKFKRISASPPETLRALLPNYIARIISLLIKIRKLPFQTTNIVSLHRKINHIKKPKIVSNWSNYQENFFYNKTVFIPSYRFKRIREIIIAQKVKTIVELAGNQGVLSRFLLESGSIDSGICTDCDEQAVDKMYLKTEHLNINLLPVILDFITPTVFYHGAPVNERLQADAVIALAVTHHLILTQNIRIETILDRLNSYTKRLVITEFMPMGLWDGKITKSIPEWYNISWFRKNFVKYFKILNEEKLEDNRILFVGLRKLKLHAFKHSDLCPKNTDSKV